MLREWSHNRPAVEITVEPRIGHPWRSTHVQSDVGIARGAGHAGEPRSRVVIASLVGTSIEFYDFYVYATAAVLVFPSLFFPSQLRRVRCSVRWPSSRRHSSAARWARCCSATSAIAADARATLIASLLTMGIATFVIGLLPAAATPGWAVLAPHSGALPLRPGRRARRRVERCGPAGHGERSAGKRAIFGTCPQLGAPIGFILANGVFIVLNLTLPREAFAVWGWRVPFLASAILVLVGLYVRFRLVETPVFARVWRPRAWRGFRSVACCVRTGGSSLLGTFIMLATYVLFYLMTTFTLTYGTTPRRRPMLPRPRRLPAGRSWRRPSSLDSGIRGRRSWSC